MTTTDDITTIARCDACGYTYQRGPAADEYQHCPRCVPGQPRPKREAMQDSTYFPGTEFVWNPLRGRGMWEPIGERVLVPVADIRALAALFPDAPFDRPALLVVRDEVLRLRGSPAPAVTDATRPRYDELADRCQRLDDDLRRKRAQCDQLRDERDALATEVARLQARR